MSEECMKITVGDRLMIGEVDYIVTQVRVDSFLRGSNIMILATDAFTMTRGNMEQERRNELTENQMKAIKKILEE